MATQKEDRRRRRPAQKPEGKSGAPEIVYTQPKPFQHRKLLVHLITVFAVVMAIFLGISVFFKVDQVMVAGCSKYSADTVWDASGIQHGESLLFFGRAQAYSQIRQNLPYVSDVRFGIKLPGTVMIIIEEIPVVYAIEAQEGGWWLMSADGKLTEQADSAAMKNCAQIVGVQVTEPQAGQQAVAYEAPRDPDATEPVTEYASDRLQAALLILQQMEANEILGQITSVNVTKLQQLQVWYGSQFQVLLGDATRLDYKLASVKQVVYQLGQNSSGILDASFTTYPDQIWNGPFDS